MSTYRILLGNVVIECSSVEDAVQIASRLRTAKVETHPDTEAQASTSHQPVASGSRWTDGRVRDFLQKAKEGAKGRVLTALLDNPDGRTQKQLIEAANLSTGRELSGVLAGVIKNAIKVGAEPNDVYQREVLTIGGEKTYEYRLTESLRQAITRNGGQINK